MATLCLSSVRFLEVFVFISIICTIASSNHKGYKLLRLRGEKGGRGDGGSDEARRLTIRLINELYDIDPITDRDLIIGPQDFGHVVATLARHGVPYEVISHDVHELFQYRNKPVKMYKKTNDKKEKRKNKTKREIHQDKYVCEGYQDSTFLFSNGSEISESIIQNEVLSYPQIVTWMRLMERKYPEVVQVQVYGRSYEGRCLYLAKVNEQRGREVVVVEGGIHAREWASVTSVLAFMHQVIRSLMGHEHHSLRTSTYVIIPVFNPDGYEYTMHTDRLWRKNRAPTIDQKCTGIDLNRNFDSEWDSCASKKANRRSTTTTTASLNNNDYGNFSNNNNNTHNINNNTSKEIDAYINQFVNNNTYPSYNKITHSVNGNNNNSHNHNNNKPTFDNTTATRRRRRSPYCSPSYKGKHPNSEAETRAFIRLMNSMRGRVKAYFSIHAFGNLWLYPYSHTNQVNSPNHHNLLRAAEAAVKEVVHRHNVSLELGAVYDLVGYSACGSSMDWMVDKVAVEYSYALELTNPENLFEINETEMAKYGEIVFTGVKAVLDEVKKMGA